MPRIVFWLLRLLVFLLPFDMMVWFTNIPSGGRLLGLLILITAILALFVRPVARRLPSAMVVMAMFLAWTMMSLAWSIDPPATLTHTGRIVALLAFVWLLWEFSSTYAQQLSLLRTFVLGQTVPLLMLYGSFVGLFGSFSSDERFTGGGQDANYVAEMLAITILIAVYLLFHPQGSSDKLRRGYWLFIPVATVAIFLTGSRAGLICLVVAALCTIFLMRFGGAKLRLALLVGAVGLFFLVRLVVPTALLTRMTGETGIQADTLQVRLGFWRHGMAIFADHPVLGVGAGCFPTALSQIGQRANVAHNVIVSVLAELGGIGLLFYLTFLFLVFRATRRMPRRERLLWRGILLIWFLASMSSGSQTDKLGWFIFAMTLAQAAALRSHAANIRNTAPSGHPLDLVRRRFPPMGPQKTVP